MTGIQSLPESSKPSIVNLLLTIFRLVILKVVSEDSVGFLLSTFSALSNLKASATFVISSS